MSIENLFPEGLDKNTLETLIPKKMDKDDKLKVYHKYYFPGIQSMYKCTNTTKVFGVEYYFLEICQRH